MFELQFIGATGTVTGSRSILSGAGKRIMLDCGLFQGPKEIRERNWQPMTEASSLDAVVLTHAHIDHSGMIPLLWKNGFRGPIYCSDATKELCKILLPDAGKIQEEDALFANRTGTSSHRPALALYTQQDAEQSLKLLESVPYQKWLDLVPGVTLRMKRSSHILGSAFLEIHCEADDRSVRLVHSGDVGSNRSLILREADAITECDALILESTYGDRKIAHTDVREDVAHAINKVTRRGGTLVIPAFSVGRTQELLFIIQSLRERGEIDDVPVYLDSPLSQKATTIYGKFDEELKTEIQGEVWRSVAEAMSFKAVTSPDDSMLLCMSEEPKIVISAAGMLTGGRVLHHLKAKLPDEKSGVLFVGYQVPGTKGALLKQGIGKIRIHHQLVDIEAEIFIVDTLSAHADSDQLVEWVGQMRKRPRRVFLHHGEPAALSALRYRLQTELELEVEIATEGKRYSLTKSV